MTTKDYQIQFPNYKVDLKQMTVKIKGDSKESYELAQLYDYERYRHQNSRRMSVIELDIQDLFCCPDELHAYLKNYGFKWGQKIKGNKFAKPTLVEIINGLKLLLQQKLYQEHSKFPKDE